MDIGQISPRHHQCEADGEVGVDDEAKEIEEVEAKVKAEGWLCWCHRNQQLQVLHYNQCL